MRQQRNSKRRQPCLNHSQCRPWCRGRRRRETWMASLSLERTLWRARSLDRVAQLCCFLATPPVYDKTMNTMRWELSTVREALLVTREDLVACRQCLHSKEVIACEMNSRQRSCAKMRWVDSHGVERSKRRGKSLSHTLVNGCGVWV